MISEDNWNSKKITLLARNKEGSGKLHNQLSRMPKGEDIV